MPSFDPRFERNEGEGLLDIDGRTTGHVVSVLRAGDRHQIINDWEPSMSRHGNSEACGVGLVGELDGKLVDDISTRLGSTCGTRVSWP